MADLLQTPLSVDHIAWVKGVKAKRPVAKLTLFIYTVDEVIRSETRRFQFERDLTFSQIDQDYQAFLVRKYECFEKAVAFVYMYVRAFAKEDGKTFNAREKDGFKSCKVDLESKCGLKRLWHTQLRYICPTVFHKKLKDDIPPPVVLYEKLERRGDARSSESNALEGVTGSKDLDMILTKMLTSDDGDLVPKK